MSAPPTARTGFSRRISANTVRYQPLVLVLLAVSTGMVIDRYFPRPTALVVVRGLAVRGVVVPCLAKEYRAKIFPDLGCVLAGVVPVGDWRRVAPSALEPFRCRRPGFHCGSG